MAPCYNQCGRHLSQHFPQLSALPASNVMASATALPSDTWRVCKPWQSAMRPFSEHKVTVRHFVGCQGPSGARRHPGGRVPVAPWWNAVTVMAVVHWVNSWHNSTANKYNFSSTNSFLSSRSCTGWFTAAVSHVDSLICNNLAKVALQPFPPQWR